MKWIILIPLFYFGFGCTYVAITDPYSKEPAGELKTFTAEGGSLQPSVITGPVEAEKPCQGRPIQGMTLRVTAGQYFWNAWLGFLGARYTVDLTCGGAEQ